MNKDNKKLIAEEDLDRVHGGSEPGEYVITCGVCRWKKVGRFSLDQVNEFMRKHEEDNPGHYTGWYYHYM